MRIHIMCPPQPKNPRLNRIISSPDPAPMTDHPKLFLISNIIFQQTFGRTVVSLMIGPKDQLPPPLRSVVSSSRPDKTFFAFWYIPDVGKSLVGAIVDGMRRTEAESEGASGE